MFSPSRGPSLARCEAAASASPLSAPAHGDGVRGKGGGFRDTSLPRAQMSASAVARAGHRGMTRGSSVVVPGVVAKILAFAGELPPRQIALEVNRLLLMPR